MCGSHPRVYKDLLLLGTKQTYNRVAESSSIYNTTMNCLLLVVIVGVITLMEPSRVMPHPYALAYPVPMADPQYGQRLSREYHRGSHEGGYGQGGFGQGGFGQSGFGQGGFGQSGFGQGGFGQSGFGQGGFGQSGFGQGGFGQSGFGQGSGSHERGGFYG
ncbi:protein lifeguard 1-like [Cherax quadricarinatus]